MLAIDQVLQMRYRIIRQLGHGGMGAVYEAIDERFGEPIALKEIIIDPVDEKQREMVSKAFEREAKALAKAKHEAVPYVRDYFYELDRQFLVMELVEGEDLAEMLIKRGVPFALEDIYKWMDQLLDALDYLHNLSPQIIHRDIKPQNLKVNNRGKIKLLDFGIARSGDKFSTITKQTFVGATLNYSPIEQILRVIDQTFQEFIVLKHKEKAEAVLSQDTDARSDIYALGGTFYHLLTNQVPVEATKRTLDVWEGKTDPLPNPSDLNPSIPTAISICLLKAMAIERDNRFSSALEMQEALKVAIAAVESPEWIRNSQNIITQAKTKPSITKKDLPVETPTEPFLPSQSASTEPIEIPVAHTQQPLGNSGFVNIPDTMPSGNFSKSDLTGTPYFNINLIEEKKTEPITESPLKEEVEKQSSGNFSWILPIAAVGILSLSGIVGVIWLNNSKSTNSSNPAPASTDLTESPTPIITPTDLSGELLPPSTTPTPVLSESPTETPKVIPTQNNSEKHTEKPKPISTPISTSEPTQNIEKVDIETPGQIDLPKEGNKKKGKKGDDDIASPEGTKRKGKKGDGEEGETRSRKIPN